MPHADDEHLVPSGRITFLVTDIEGSSKLTARLGEAAYRNLVQSHLSQVRDIARQHHGYTFKDTGDGLLISFQNAQSALECAIAIQQALVSGESASPCQAIRARIGIHTTRSAIAPEPSFAHSNGLDYKHQDVHIVARVGQLGGGSQIFASSSAYLQFGSHAGFRWQAWRARLKGFWWHSESNSLTGKIADMVLGREIWECLWQGKSNGEPNKTIRWWIRRGLVVFLLTIGFLFALGSYHRKVALSRKLTASAIQQLDSDPELGLLLAREALLVRDDDNTESALRQTLANSHVRLSLPHPAPIIEAIFNEAGNRVLTLCTDGDARVWDAASGNVISVLHRTNKIVFAQFASRGRAVLTKDDAGFANLWQGTTDLTNAFDFLESGGNVLAATFHSESNVAVTIQSNGTFRVWKVLPSKSSSLPIGVGVTTAIISPNGAGVVAGSTNGTLFIRDLVAERHFSVQLSGKPRINHIVFSPDSARIVVSCSDGTARLVNPQTGGLEASLSHPDTEVSRSTYSRNGKHLVCIGAKNTLRVWDALSKELIGDANINPNHRITAVEFDPNGRYLLFATLSGNVCIFDIDSRQIHYDFISSRPHSTSTVMFNPDGDLILTSGSDSFPSQDGVTRIWETYSTRLVASLRGHSMEVRSAVWSPRGDSILTASWDGTARVWAKGFGSLKATIRWPDMMEQMFLSPDCTTIVSVGFRSGGKIWDVKTERLRTEISGGLQGSFNADGSYFVGSGTGNAAARIWDAKTWKVRADLVGHTGYITGTKFCADGARVATCSADGTAAMWDANSGVCLRIMRGSNDVFSCLGASDNGKYIAAATGAGKALVWDAESGELKRVLELPTGDIKTLSFNKDSSRLLTAGDGSLWNLKTGNREFLFNTRVSGYRETNHATTFVNERALYDVLWASFTPDDRCVITVHSDNIGRVWDTRRGSLLTTMQRTQSMPHQVSLSPNGKFIGIGAIDGLVSFYDVATGRIIGQLSHQKYVTGITWGADNKTVVTSGPMKGAMVYECVEFGSIDELQKLIPSRLTRTLSTDERQRFLGR